MIKIKDYEIVDPLDLIKGIDETMNIIEKDDFKMEPEVSKELIYNLLFLSRTALLLNAAIIKKLNLNKTDIKEEIDGLYS